MNTPYNTGKILIGVYYAPDLRPMMTADDITIQGALLAAPIKNKPSLMRAFFALLLGG